MTEAAPTRRLRPSRPTPSTHLSPHSSQPSALPSPPLSTARRTSPGLVSGSSAVGAGRPGGYSTFSSSGSGEMSLAGSSAREKDYDRNRDVFGDVGASPALGRAASPGVKGSLAGASRTMPSPVSMGRSGGKGKGAVRDYGDRFIPNRDGTDLHAAYKLLPDPIAGGASGRRRKSNVGQASDVEARKEEDNAMFSQLLRSELLSPRSPSRTASPSHPPPRASPSRHAQLRRPIAASYGTSHVSHQSSRYPSSSAGTTPLHHYPPPATSGIGSGIPEGSGRERELSPASTLPPLPLHAPSTPNSSRTHGIDGLYGAGPSSAGHRAHQSQVALSGPGHRASPGAPASPPESGSGGVGAGAGVGGSGNGYARRHTRNDSFDHTKLPLSPPSHHADEPGTPSKKRLLNFVSSPASNRMAALTNGYGYGYGLDNMDHERYSTSPVGKRSQEVLLSPRKGVRSIGRTPFKVLDAPELADDFYLNLVSWSSSNVLAVGLNSCVYLWSAQTSKVTKLCDMAGLSGTGEEVNDAVTGLDWTNRGSTIAIGTSRGTVEIWDAEHCKKLRTMTGHSARVGSLAWNNHILSTGSRDRTILHRDVRVPDHYIRKLSGHHKQEVCGLKWNTQTDQLASGGNDNKLYIWSATDSRPTWKFGEHRAAVKAIAWSPHQRGVLASGGGTADKKIRFWNSMTGGLVSEWDTGSQVCNLMYSLNSNELVSTHGYSGGPISNQIHIWRYPSMTQVATLTGHTYRVLYLAMSPDGQTIVTGAGDETLRFWNAFPKAPGKKSVAGGGEGVGVGSGGGDVNPFVQLR